MKLTLSELKRIIRKIIIEQEEHEQEEHEQEEHEQKEHEQKEHEHLNTILDLFFSPHAHSQLDNDNQATNLIYAFDDHDLKNLKNQIKQKLNEQIKKHVNSRIKFNDQTLYLTNMTDSFLNFIIDLKLINPGKINHIIFNSSTHLTDISKLIDLFIHNNLETLDLSGCENLQSDCLTSLPSLINLNIIKFNGCNSITKKYLLYVLAPQLPPTCLIESNTHKIKGVYGGAKLEPRY